MTLSVWDKGGRSGDSPISNFKFISPLANRRFFPPLIKMTCHSEESTANKSQTIGKNQLKVDE